jgi:hypothetical protein
MLTGRQAGGIAEDRLYSLPGRVRPEAAGLLPSGHSLRLRLGSRNRLPLVRQFYAPGQGDRDAGITHFAPGSS